MHPLAEFRIVELTTGVAGRLCGKVLADAGASVTYVDPIASALDEPSRANSVSADWATFLDLDKDVLALEPASGASQINALLAEADLFLTTMRHDRAARWELDCESVLAQHEHIAAACVTPFGQTGPYADFVADDLVISALCGLADATPGVPITVSVGTNLRFRAWRLLRRRPVA